MGEALLYTASVVIAVTVVGAIIIRMVAQVVKDSGREKKVTECIASLNMLMAHLSVYKTNAARSPEERAVINGMIEAWNARYSRWRGYQKIPTVVS